jgi:hypothetical protein
VLNRFWQGLQSMLGESTAALTAAAPLPPCDLAVTQADRVLELLRLLESDRGALNLQSSEGQGLGRARVFAVTKSQVTLRCGAALGHTAERCVNVVGSSSLGAVMFTLRLMPTSLGDLWRAPLPDEVLCVQSRQHRRVEIVRSLGHEAELLTARRGMVRRVLDLSESGAALDLCGSPKSLLTLGEAVLKLDGMRILVPRLEVVHTHESTDGQVRAGVRLADLPSEETRHLRRWLNAAETALLTPKH